MQFSRWTLAVVALAVASPAAAQVYRLEDGVVRVRHGSTSSTSTSTSSSATNTPIAAARHSSDSRRVSLVAMQSAAPAQPAPDQPVSDQPAAYQPAWDRSAAAPMLDQAAAEAGLHPALLEALVWQESRWHPGAVSRKGAIGLTQLMPGTARELGVDPRDPSANLMGGARYLRSLIDHFDGDLVKALAAYNSGVGRVERAGGVPPIAETQQYVLAILGRVTATVSRR